MKKVCSILLTLLLALTAAIPGYASETDPEAALSPTQDTVVSVTVPQTGHIVINPYGLPVDVDGGTSREQIVSEPLPIENHGGTPVTVWVSAVGSISEESSMEFVPDLSQLDTGSKAIFLYAEFKKDGEPWRGCYENGANQVLIGDQISDPQEVLSLDEEESSGAFQLFGSTSVTPNDPWGAEDEIHVTFTFTFRTPGEVSDVQAAEEEAPPTAEEPTVEEEPPSDEEPATEDEPPADEEPATGEEPPADEEPFVEEEPPVGEEPAAEDEPPADEEPATDEELPDEEEPVAEDASTR